MRSAAGAVAIISSFAVVLAAQRGAEPQTQQPTFRARADLIQVDTLVVDKEGRPVRGLTKADFQLLDNGKPQEIVALTEYQHERVVLGAEVEPAQVDVATNSGPAAQRLVLIMLDDLGIQSWDWEKAKEAIRQFIRELGGQLQITLVRSSGESGVELTNDPKILFDTLGTFKWLQRPTDVRQYREQDQGLWRSGNAMRFLTPNDGRRKVMLLVTHSGIKGISPDDPSITSPRLPPSPTGVDPRDVAAISDPKLTSAQRFAAEKAIMNTLSRELREAIEAARRANAAIYAIDPAGKTIRGLEGYGGSGLSTGLPFAVNDRARIASGGLRVIAAETGGYAVTQNDDIAAGVARIADELSNYYVLGFQAPDPGSTKPHEIEVRLNRPDLEVRHRRSYVTKAQERPEEKAAKKDPLLGLAHSPIPTRDLPLKLWARLSPPEAAATTATRIGLWLESTEAIVDEYSIYVIDQKKKKETEKPISRTLSGAVPSLLPLESFTLTPGSYQLRVSARNTQSGRGGSVYITLEVPDFRALPLAIANVTFGTGSARRRDLGDLPFAPTLDRAFDASANVRLAFDVWRQPSSAEARVIVEIVGLDGAVVSRVHDAPAPASGRVEVPVALSGLKPGPYSLVIFAITGSDAARAQRKVAIAVSDSGRLVNSK
jgi:VWFA-related protein